MLSVSYITSEVWPEHAGWAVQTLGFIKEPRRHVKTLAESEYGWECVQWGGRECGSGVWEWGG